MPRYKLIVEYDGTPFSGWQIQDNAPTVQGALETAVKAICGEQVRMHGAGRTDAGVHALGQVAHCDIAKHFVPGRFRDGLNAHLRPHPIGVLSAEIVPDTFEARFSAIKRHYLYRIINRRADLTFMSGHQAGQCAAGLHRQDPPVHAASGVERSRQRRFLEAGAGRAQPGDIGLESDPGRLLGKFPVVGAGDKE